MVHETRSRVSPAVAWLASLVVATPAIGQDLAWFDAIRTQDFDTLESLFDDEADLSRTVDSLGGRVTPLAIAIVGHREDVALWLLERGAEFAESEQGRVIDAAAQHGMSRVLEVLARRDRARSSNRRFYVMQRSLEVSAAYGHFEVVDLMLRLSKEFDEPIPIEDVESAALIALRDNDDIARRLIDFIGAPFPGGLAAAAYMGSPGLVRELLDRGANPYEEYEALQEARLPVEWAIYRHTMARSPFDQEVARLIVHELWATYRYKEDIAQRAASMARNGREYLSALAIESPERAFIEAAHYGYYDIVRDAIQAGMPGIDRGSHVGVLADAVRAALLVNHADVARLLLESGAPPDQGALHAAARGSSPGMVRYLLSLSADPLARFEGRTPEAYWLERVETEGSAADRDVLYELVVGGADVCWLTDQEIVLRLHIDVLRDRAPHCWADELRGELRELMRNPN